MTPVFVIGFDAGTWKNLSGWIDKGHLPNLSKLINNGVSGILNTTIPPITGSAWVSFFTGKNPGKHGIYDFFTLDGKLINSQSIKGRKLWQILSDYGKRCCLINVPVTYPIEPINGYVVSDFLTPANEKSYYYPEKIGKILKKFNYKIELDFGRLDFDFHSKETIKRRYHYLKPLEEISDNRCNFVKEILNEKWDFFMVVLKSLDVIQHYFWDRQDIVLGHYKKIDKHLGDMVEKIRANNNNPVIIVMSDHGFSSSPVEFFNMRAWMVKEGFLENENKMLRALMQTYNKIKSTKLSRLLFSFKTFKNIREKYQLKATIKNKIFYNYPGIYIHKDSSEESEYEALREKLIEKLSKINGKNEKKKLFKLVAKREEIYTGNKISDAPDIVALPNNEFGVSFTLDSRQIWLDKQSYLPGNHFSDIEGIFVANGNIICKNKKINANIIDLTPTILYILDVPIPSDMDGKILFGILTDKYRKRAIKKIDSVEEQTNREKNLIQNAILNNVRIQ